MDETQAPTSPIKLSDFNITEQTILNGITHTRAPDAAFLESKYEFGDKLGQYPSSYT